MRRRRGLRTHSINYNNWLPTLTARYRVWNHGRSTRQFAEGSVIPPSAVFDVPGGNVLTPPKPTLAKTYQVGSVLKLNRWTLDMDATTCISRTATTPIPIPPPTNPYLSPPVHPIPKVSRPKGM